MIITNCNKAVDVDDDKSFSAGNGDDRALHMIGSQHV